LLSSALPALHRRIDERTLPVDPAFAMRASMTRIVRVRDARRHRPFG
jgi:hypothetical protein